MLDLVIRDVRKSFGEIRAVDGLSLEIERGEVFGFLGPNGAGKSTTIGIAVGLIDPDSGEVDLCGNGSPTAAASRMHVGVAPQSVAIYDELTAMQNLMFFGSIYGMSRSACVDRATELLAFAGLTDRANDRAKTYSGGMKRRLNLAAALMHGPQLVLLDEPTVGVDPQSRQAIYDMVEQMRDSGKTVVYTTHYMEEAQRLCDRVAIIDHGRLLALDSVDGLIASHGGKSLVTVRREKGDERVQSDEPARDLERLLANGDVLEVRVERPSLEAVFLTLTGRSLRD